MARRFEIRNRIGASGFGEFFVSVDRHGTPGVIELVHRTNAHAVDLEMLRECAARTRLASTHPHVVEPLGLVSVYGRPGIVYKLFAGRQLSMLAFGHRLDARSALEFAREVAQALDYSWSEARFNHAALRWQHGNLQPSCIFVTSKGGLSIVEFGLVDAVIDMDERRPDLESTAVFNALAYLSPERVAGGSGAEADVYSLGIILFELLTGNRLGGQLTSAVSEDAHVEGVETRSAALREMVDYEPLVELIADMTAFDRKQRPTRAELVERCDALLGDAPGTPFASWAEVAVTEADRVHAESPPTLDHNLIGVTTTLVAVGPPSVLMDQFATPPPTQERVGHRPVVGLDLPPMSSEEIQEIRRQQMTVAMVMVVLVLALGAAVASSM